MRKIVGSLLLVSVIVPAASAQVYVKPHIRADGTFVQGHNRTAPNSTRMDNYSTDGNVNPYNGRQGTQPSYPTYPNYPVYQTPRVQTQPRYQQPANPFGSGPKCTYPCF